MKNYAFALLLVASLGYAQDDEAILDQPIVGGEAIGTETVVPDAAPVIVDSDVVVPVGNPAPTQEVNSKPINVDGYVNRPKPITDNELEGIKAEIVKQRKEVKLNQAKAKSYQQLSKSVEQLSETTEEYLEGKNDAQKQIAEYNLMVKCKSSESQAEECSKWNKRR